jgi:hypothetical protein
MWIYVSPIWGTLGLMPDILDMGKSDDVNLIKRFSGISLSKQGDNSRSTTLVQSDL